MEGEVGRWKESNFRIVCRLQNLIFENYFVSFILIVNRGKKIYCILWYNRNIKNKWRKAVYECSALYAATPYSYEWIGMEFKNFCCCFFVSFSFIHFFWVFSPLLSKMFMENIKTQQVTLLVECDYYIFYLNPLSPNSFIVIHIWVPFGKKKRDRKKWWRNSNLLHPKTI